jgi:membrane protease YdiL (CAAX protease family)
VPHALNVLAGADPVRTTAQLVWAFLLGLVFAALTVAGGTVWPVALLHGLGNALIHANRLGHDGATEPAAAVLLALAPLPLVTYSWFVLRRGRQLERAPAAPS